MKCRALGLVVALALCSATTRGDVFNMGEGLTSLEMVPVGDPGNASDTRYRTPGYGSVAYRYMIGKYEVTAGQYTEFLNSAAKTDPHGLYNAEMDSHPAGCQITQNGTDGNYTYDFSGRPSGTEADWADRPIGHVSWYDAAMFANWLTSGDINQGAYDVGVRSGWGSSLADRYTGVTAHDSPEMDDLIDTYGTVYVIPTEDEWRKAAYYDPTNLGYWDYPTQHAAPSVPDGIDFAGDTEFDAVFHDGYNQRHSNDVDNAGVLSAYGTMGQGGNVFEWSETIVGSSRDTRGLRGGRWYWSSSYLHVNNNVSGWPTGDDFGIGFRVASVPEPGSITLLVCGALAVTVGWWRRRRAA